MLIYCQPEHQKIFDKELLLVAQLEVLLGQLLHMRAHSFQCCCVAHDYTALQCC